MSRRPDPARSWAARLGLGRALYYGWHWPRGQIEACARAGGPIEQWRTARGRRAMRRAASELPAPPASSAPPLRLHLITGRRYWYQAAFCLYSLALRSGRPVAPTIYDDGSLTAVQLGELLRLFPLARAVSRQEAVNNLDRHLPRSTFPVLRERWEHFVLIRKLIDPHLGSSEWKLGIDSDLLFFRSPRLLEDWLAAPDRPLRATDVMNAYGYPLEWLNEIAGHPVDQRVNTGLLGLRGSEIDWGNLERSCRELIERGGTNYYMEQALVAILLAGRDCVVAPADDYVTLPRPPEALECRAVMHHYVADSKRWYFRSNWRRVLGS